MAKRDFTMIITLTPPVGPRSDNVTQDVDSSRKGPETITVSAVRSGTYRYYVHNYTNKGQKNHMGLYKVESFC